MIRNSEDAIWMRLAQPFDPEAVNLRIILTTKDKTRGLVAPYVHARTIMKRLDDVAGVEGWHDHYEAIGSGGECVFVRCSLSVAGVTKEDVGSGDDYKGATSDSLKRASVKFGIGRYLYAAEKLWVRLDQRGAVENESEAKARMLSPFGTKADELHPESTNGRSR